MEVTTNTDFKLKITNENILDLVDKKKLQPHLKSSLTNIINDERLLTFELEIDHIKPSGGNYLGELYVVQIKGNTEKKYKQINIFIKSILPMGKDLEFISLDEVYVREIFVYTKLRDVFEALQSIVNIPENEKFKLAQFYETSNKKAIIMEDLTIKGFKVPERTTMPSLIYCEMAVKQLAKFHALSFVMKREKQEFYEKEIVCKKSLYNFNEVWVAYMKKFAQTAVDALKRDEAKERVEKYLREVDWQDKFNYCMNTNTKDVNVGVFCHGDYRAQNIMMREKDGVCTEILAVDYQLTYYGHPVNDIIFFIVGNTDQEFRRRHMDHLTTLYYDTMKNYMLYFDMDIEKIYPRKQYIQDFKDRLDYAVAVGLCFLHFFYPSEDDVINHKTDLTSKNMPVSNLYTRCMNELVDDFIKWGLL